MQVNNQPWAPYSTPGHLINRLARSFARVGEARLRPFGFGVGQLPVLFLLKDGSQRSQKELVLHAQMEQPSMAQLLARMERDGVVQRHPDPNDRRSTLFSLTPATMARLPAMREVLMQGNTEAMAGFSDEETALFAAFLQRALANIEAIGVEPPLPEPLCSPGSMAAVPVPAAVPATTQPARPARAKKAASAPAASTASTPLATPAAARRRTARPPR